MFGELADEAAAKLRKGQQIALHGKLRVRLVAHGSAAFMFEAPFLSQSGRPAELAGAFACPSVLSAASHCTAHMLSRACRTRSIRWKASSCSRSRCAPQIVSWNDRETGQPRTAAKVIADQLAIVKPYSVRHAPSTALRLDEQMLRNALLMARQSP